MVLLKHSVAGNKKVLVKVDNYYLNVKKKLHFQNQRAMSLILGR